MIIQKVKVGLQHIATVATLIGCVRVMDIIIAVDKLLLRERMKLSELCKVGTLEDSNSGKGPA